MKIDKLKIRMDGNEKLTEKLKEFTEKSLEKILAIISEEDLRDLFVTYKKRNNDTVKVELTLMTKNNQVFKKETSGDNFYDVLPSVVDNVHKQILRNKEKRIKVARKRRKVGKRKLKESIFLSEKSNLIKTRSIEPIKVSEEDAIKLIEDSDKDFFVYIDKITEIPTILRRIDNGEYNKIEVVGGY